MFNILVVDDQAHIRRLYEYTLEKNGYQPFTAGDGAEALRLMENTHIDLVILDLMMPTMDGYTFNGWYTEPVGGSRITTATVFTGDTTIYAQWTAKSSSARPTTPTLPVTGGPALQKHLGTLLVAGILVTLVVVAAV